MGNQNIGNLSATITANAQQLIDEFRRAQAAMVANTDAVTKGAEKIERGAVKIGLGMAGAQTAARLAIQEIRGVIENIDKIPNVPQGTIDSINQMKYALASANNVLQQSVAAVAGWVAEMGTGIGYGLGAIVYGTDAASEGFERMQKEADAFVNKDFNRKFAELQNQFDRLSVGTKGKMATLLSEEATALERFAETGVVEMGELKNAMLENLKAQTELQGGATTSDRQEASLQAARDRIEAQRTLNELQKEYRTILRGEETEDLKARAALMSKGEALRFLTAKQKEVQEAISRNAERFGSDLSTIENNPEALEKYNELAKKSLEIRKAIDAAQRDNLKWANDVGAAFTNNFESAALSGKKLQDVLSDLGKDLEKILLHNLITQPLGDAISGLFKTKTSGSSTGGILSIIGGLFGFAGGGSPPVGVPSIVGEEGPELFVPRESGTVLPTGVTGALFSRSSTRSGDTFFIDATGADAAKISQLESIIRSIGGSVERRAVAAVIAAKRAGGGNAAALA